jgi:hypothetical protein
MPRQGQLWEPRLLSAREEFGPFRALLAELSAHEDFPALRDLTALVETARQARAAELAPLEFVAAAPRRRRRRGPVAVADLYDARVVRLGQVPCYRASYHDLFNAVTFAAFPRAKRALHQRQYAALLASLPEDLASLPGRRTREQDALTLMDEGGSVVLVPETARSAFTPGTLHTLVGPRARARLVVFGHALLEQLAYGYRELRSTARLLWLSEPAAGSRVLEVVDDHLSSLFGDATRFVAPGSEAVVEWRSAQPPTVKVC